MTTRTEGAGPPPAGDAARGVAIGWHADQHDLICDAVEPWAHGRLLRAAALPTYWDYNLVYARGALEGLEAGDLMAVADAHHGDLAHRNVQIEDEDAGARLRPGFEAAGWTVTPLVFMVHAGPLPAVPDGLALREAPDAAAGPLRRRWYPEEAQWARDSSALEAFLRDEAAVHDRLGGHVLLAGGAGEDATAYVRVVLRGDAGEISEAYVVPEARGAGTGGGLVAAGARAIAAAGARHVLIVAEAEDRPRHLYARMGFVPAWTMHQCQRIPGGG